MTRPGLIIIVISALTAGCFNTANVTTIESLSKKTINLNAPIQQIASNDTVIDNYETFLKMSQPGALHSDALRRLADLKLEASEEKNISTDAQLIQESHEDLNSAVELYQAYLKNYPSSPNNELILYQLSKAYSLSGQIDEALETMTMLVERFPQSRYMDEIQFRLAEIYFAESDHELAARAYKVIVDNHTDSIFYQKALYKYAWALFKKNDYTSSIDHFLMLLKHIDLAKNIENDSLSKKLPRAEQELITDTLRIISIALSYQNGADSLVLYISKHNIAEYEALLFRQLGDLYIKKERILDAANTYLAYTKRNPDNSLSPKFHSSAIDAYKKGGFPSLILAAKKSFSHQYNIGGHFWIKQTEQSKAYLRPLLSLHILDLAKHHHARAKKSRELMDYKIAATWYRTYLKGFPEHNNAAYINFLLAESLFDSHDYFNAIKEYEITSYQYKKNQYSAEAGYAALLAYKNLLKKITADKKQLKIASLKSALKFSQTYPEDKRANTVLASVAEDYYQLNDYQTSSSIAQKLINTKPGKKLGITAYTVHAHSQFELKKFDTAESSYKKLLKLIPVKNKSYKPISEKLAACIYKQAEQHQLKGELMLAAKTFLRLGKTVPSSSIRATAEYDAASIYIQQEQWTESIKLLEAFRKRYSGNKKLKLGVTEKLALAYTKTANHTKAARELLKLASSQKDVVYKNQLKRQAAEHFEKSKKPKKAINIYISISQSNTEPFDQQIELQNVIAQYYKKSKQTKKWHHWLKEIIKSNELAGTQRSDESNLLAANAELVLIQPSLTAYKKIKLNIPLKKSLKKKKALMLKLIKSYQKVIPYQLASSTTAATYQIAESYQHFANALMDSQRPKGLSDDELEQYEILLEEQAYPFEEKAIAIHETNLKQTQNGIYNNWIKNSLKSLGKILPVRYVKPERIDDYVDVKY